MTREQKKTLGNSHFLVSFLLFRKLGGYLPTIFGVRGATTGLETTHALLANHRLENKIK